MIGSVVITAGAVVVGAGLGAVTTRENVLMGGLRTFASAAVVAAVVVQLLPEAVAAIGGYALMGFVAAIAAPVLAGPLLKRLRHGAGVDVDTLGADIAFYGFVVHQWAEGVALGTVTSPQHGHDHLDLVIGIAAHTVPMTAVFVASAIASRRRGSAWRRTTILVVATVAGFGTADFVGRTALHSVQPWAAALAAGFLVHVLLHSPEPTARRVKISGPLDLLGAAVGGALPLLVGHGHDIGHDVGAVREELGHAFIELALETAPMLLLGLALGAALQVLGSRIPSRYFTSGGSMRQALRGIAVGAPLPLCACGVLPIAEALRKRGAGPAMVMAFLVATPELGPETLTLTVRFLGGPFAVVRLGAALLLAFLAALAFARIAGWKPKAADEPSPEQSMIMGGAPEAKVSAAKVYGYFDELLLHTAPWTLVGLAAAAYVQVVLPAGSLVELTTYGLDVVVVGLVAMPTYVCAAAATPLAAVLLVKGVSPGAVLVGLLLGPATNVATVGLLRKAYGARSVLLGVVTIMVVAYGLGFAVNLFGIEAAVPDGLLEEHRHGWMALLTAGGLGVALVAQLWRWGPHPWLEILDVQHDHSHGHSHSHSHGHDHDHDHDHGHRH